ncbi:hypothetical protein CsSME_00011497 [Camellia sinensis var. sinensis]
MGTHTKASPVLVHISIVGLFTVADNKYSYMSEPSVLKLPDASLLLNATHMSSSLVSGYDHSSRVAAAMAECESRKREASELASSVPRGKVPRGALPNSRNVQDTVGGLYDTINNSIHFQLGLALASLGVIASLVAQHMYSLPAYAFISLDFTTQAALYTHHQYIAGFIITGAFAHGAIFFIRDYNLEQNEDNGLFKMSTLIVFLVNLLNQCYQKMLIP